MADYIARMRTSYFPVRDEEAFRESLKRWGLDIAEQGQGRDQEKRFCVYGEGLPFYARDVEGYETDEDINFLAELGRHVQDGWLAIIIETGYENYRQLEGFAWAVGNNGTVATIQLVDIYEEVRGLGQFTQASW